MNFLTYPPPVEEKSSEIWRHHSLAESHPATFAFDVVSSKQLAQSREERAEYETRRVAAAFGVEVWRKSLDGGESCFQGTVRDMSVIWKLEERQGVLRSLSVGHKSKRCVLSLERDLNWGGRSWGTTWEFEPQREFHNWMARGLYSLGFDDAAILVQLPTLSRHEQMECMIEMPREFWPVAWLKP